MSKLANLVVTTDAQVPCVDRLSATVVINMPSVVNRSLFLHDGGC